MNRKYGITYQYAFLCLYFFMVLSITLDMAGGFPYTSILRKIKYVYIVVAGFLYFRNKRKSGIGRLSGINTWMLFMLHTLLFGYIFSNKDVEIYIHEHTTQMIWYLLILLVTFLSVIKYKIFNEFIITSYIALGITILWACIRNLSDIRHPKFWLGVFGLNSIDRWKATFGFFDANYCGYYCMTLIVLSVFIIDNLYKCSQCFILNKWMFSILTLDFIALLMLLSSGSRSNVLSLCVFIWSYIYLYPQVISKRKAGIIRSVMNLIIALGIIAIVSTSLFGSIDIIDYIWKNSNRVENISINYAVFKQMNSWLTGMGYVENTYFALDVFGYDTWNIDMYYQYIFFSTGILGIGLIAVALLLILFHVVPNLKKRMGVLEFSLYISMLFNAFWQVNICTYRFYPSFILMTILLYYISTKNNDGGDYKYAGHQAFS